VQHTRLLEAVVERHGHENAKDSKRLINWVHRQRVMLKSDAASVHRAHGRKVNRHDPGLGELDGRADPRLRQFNN